MILIFMDIYFYVDLFSLRDVNPLNQVEHREILIGPCTLWQLSTIIQDFCGETRNPQTIFVHLIQ